MTGPDGISDGAGPDDLAGAGSDGHAAGPVREGTKARLRELVRDALTVIQDDPGGDVRLSEVARRIGASRRSLQRAFENEGMTFRSAVALARMRRAEVLLHEGARPVYEVAHRVGYRSKAEFTKAFKRHAGVTPTEFRGRARPASTDSP